MLFAVILLVWQHMVLQTLYVLFAINGFFTNVQVVHDATLTPYSHRWPLAVGSTTFSRIQETVSEGPMTLMSWDNYGLKSINQSIWHEKLIPGVLFQKHSVTLLGVMFATQECRFDCVQHPVHLIWQTYDCNSKEAQCSQLWQRCPCCCGPLSIVRPILISPHWLLIPFRHRAVHVRVPFTFTAVLYHLQVLWVLLLGFLVPGLKLREIVLFQNLLRTTLR